MRPARINGTVRVLCKTRLIFPRINGPIGSWKNRKIDMFVKGFDVSFFFAERWFRDIFL